MAAVDRHRLGVVDELHPAALPRPGRGEVAAEVVGRQLVELRVDARAVVALAVVLADELPVRVDFVGDRVRDAELGEVEPREMGRQVAEPLDQWRRLLGQADEDEALPRLHPHADEPEVLHVEVVEVLGVLGADEVPLEVVDPGVVRALEPDGRATRLLDDRGAAMAADVVERAQVTVATAGDQQRLVVDRRQEVRARRRGILLAPDDHPLAAEPLAPLEIVDRRVVVGPAGQQRRRPIRLADGFDLGLGQRARGHDFGTSLRGSRNGMAAVLAGQRPPSGASISRALPAPASSIGTHT